MMDRQALGIAVIAMAWMPVMIAPVEAIHPGGHNHFRSSPSGDVLAESSVYHRGYANGLSAASTMPHAAATRYTYGFPVKTYRWGWFGATQYYPRSFSHRGYNGDQWNWAYRRGY